jgi:hypothetical protein
MLLYQVPSSTTEGMLLLVCFTRLACPGRTAKPHLSVKLLASMQGPQPFHFLDFVVPTLQAQLESGGPIT